MSSKCRFCKATLKHSFCNLGCTPFSNSYVEAAHLHSKEPTYPLHAFVCEHCLLVQIDEFEKPETIFGVYSYFSSYSDSWLNHAKNYVQEMIPRFKLGAKNQVIEIASNDGYLLQYFQKEKIPTLGIEPAKNVAAIAQNKGISTITDFFTRSLAASLKNKGIQADLLVANNVLAHVPNLTDFVAGIKVILSKIGLATLEFPHLLCLIQKNQFDTIYHEHFSYFSFNTVERIFASHNLAIFDVESIATHGGSLRIYVKHLGDHSKPQTDRVAEMKDLERKSEMLNLDFYLNFERNVKFCKNEFVTLLNNLKNDGKRVAAYGAPAKGNTLLNYCGITSDLIQYTVDRSPHKQNKYLPGSLIPIFSPSKITETKPDYLVLLPWNLKEELLNQLQFIREWGGKFIITIPEPMVIE